jgi:hypothetical protein
VASPQFVSERAWWRLHSEVRIVSVKPAAICSGVGVDKYRTLEVTVDGYRATTRKGYTGTLP